MRSPARIEPFLVELARLWKAYPDMRFGQLVTNLTPPREDGWNDEDDEWQARIILAQEGVWPRRA